MTRSTYEKALRETKVPAPAYHPRGGAPPSNSKLVPTTRPTPSLLPSAPRASAAGPGGRSSRIRHKSKSRSSIVSLPPATGSECRPKLISRSAGRCLFLNQSAPPPDRGLVWCRPTVRRLGARPRQDRNPARRPVSAAAARPPNPPRSSSQIQNPARASRRQSRRAATRSPATAPATSPRTR